MRETPCDCPRCLFLGRLSLRGDDPGAPLAFERWLQETSGDDWPFWLLGGLIVLLGLLLGGPGEPWTLVVLVAGIGVGSLPTLRDRQDACRRLTAPAERERERG